jgi:hypothetical protein
MGATTPGSAMPGPGGGEAARILAGMLGDPLAGYLRLTARYGDVVRVPFAPRRWWFLLSRPEHAEHVRRAGRVASRAAPPVTCWMSCYMRGTRTACR